MIPGHGTFSLKKVFLLDLIDLILVQLEIVVFVECHIRFLLFLLHSLIEDLLSTFSQISLWHGLRILLKILIVHATLEVLL